MLLAQSTSTYESRGLQLPYRAPRRERKLEDEAKRAASGLRLALAPFTRLRKDVPLQYVTTFLLVAEHEGEAIGWYAERAKVSKSVMSRHILDLSIKQRSGEPGYGYLETRTNPQELRAKSVHLTEEGMAVARAILQAWVLAGGK